MDLRQGSLRKGHQTHVDRIGHHQRMRRYAGRVTNRPTTCDTVTPNTTPTHIYHYSRAMMDAQEHGDTDDEAALTITIREMRSDGSGDGGSVALVVGFRVGPPPPSGRLQQIPFTNV